MRVEVFVANPPGSGTFEQEFQQLRARLDELARRRPVHPACQVRLGGRATLPAGIDTLAQAGWFAADDTQNMFTGGAAGKPCLITVPVAGLYSIHYHSSANGPASGAAASKVYRNGTSVSVNPVATDVDVFKPNAGDGAVLDAVRPRILLNAGDRIYWSNWASADANLEAAVFSVPTEITVRFLGSP